MEKETKDALIFFAPIVLVILVVGVFIAVENTNVDFDFDKYFLKDSADAGIYGEIDGAVWATSIVNFFGWENTWASFIMGLAVLIMLYAALYEILGFTNFEKEWVKQVIAIAIAVIIAVSRGVVVIAAFFLALAGESIILATLVAILIAIVFFIIGTFFKGRLKIFKAKEKAHEAEAGAIDAATGVHVSKRMAEAARIGA